ANPCRDHGQIFSHVLAIEGICLQRMKRDSAPTFSQSVLFPPKGSVDQAKDAQRRAVIWLSTDNFLLLRSCGSEGGPCLALIFHDPSDQTFHERPIEVHRIVAKTVFAGCHDSIGSYLRIALRQGA